MYLCSDSGLNCRFTHAITGMQVFIYGCILSGQLLLHYPFYGYNCTYSPQFLPKYENGYSCTYHSVGGVFCFFIVLVFFPSCFPLLKVELLTVPIVMKWVQILNTAATVTEDAGTLAIFHVFFIQITQSLLIQIPPPFLVPINSINAGDNKAHALNDH